VHGENWTWHPNERQHVLAKCCFVCPDDPTYQGRRERIEGHEARVDRPFLLDNASVQDHQARDALQSDEGGRGQLPGIVALVQPVRRGRTRGSVPRGSHDSRYE
jgi:hypothetical protein